MTGGLTLALPVICMEEHAAAPLPEPRIARISVDAGGD